MNRQEYNRMIEETLKTKTAQTGDALATARAVLNRMGISLPQGDLKQVSEALATDDYMGWRKCTVKEAQEYANNGTAVVGVSDDQIAVVAANDEEGEVAADSAAVMTLSESTSALAVSDTAFYASSAGSTCSSNNNEIHFSDDYIIREVGWKGNISLCGASGSTVQWWSSDLNVATIDRVTGLITAVGEGNTTISVTTSNGGSASFILHVDGLTIYQTAKTFYLDENYQVPEDLHCGDLSQQQMKEVMGDYYSALNSSAPESLRASWEDLCRITSIEGRLQPIILDMVSRFMSGNTLDYQNDILTDEVKNDIVMEQYTDTIKTYFLELLNEYNGQIAGLKYFPGDTTLKENNTVRNNIPLVKKLKENRITEPSFNGLVHKINGLAMAIHSFWGHLIRIKSFHAIGNNYSGTLTFEFYDHFGLDQADIVNNNHQGFRAWYFLQHHEKFNHAYQPFTTIVEFDVNFSGTL